jgi:hypothetical protein
MVHRVLVAMTLTVSSLMMLGACNSELGSQATDESAQARTQATNIHAVYHKAPAETYSASRLLADWPKAWVGQGIDEGRVSVIHEENWRLRIKYDANVFGPGGGAQWKYRFAERDQAQVEYRLKFASDFDFVLGGKLPGLCGAACNTGGKRPTGDDGWSARFMWIASGRAVAYVYHAAQRGTYGDSIQLKWPDGTDVYFDRNQWYTIQERVTMNTPGIANGRLEVWLNGSKVLDRSDFLWRNTSSIKVNAFYISTFFGGSGSEWAPKKDEYLWLDNFIITAP